VDPAPLGLVIFVPLPGCPNITPTPSLNSLGSIVSELGRGQTNKQTDGLENPTHADRHSRRG